MGVSVVDVEPRVESVIIINRWCVYTLSSCLFNWSLGSSLWYRLVGVGLTTVITTFHSIDHFRSEISWPSFIIIDIYILYWYILSHSRNIFSTRPLLRHSIFLVHQMGDWTGRAAGQDEGGARGPLILTLILTLRTRSELQELEISRLKGGIWAR